MSKINHSEMVKALVKPGATIANELTPEQADLWHGATGVAGEATEILDAVLAGALAGQTDRENMVEELGDMEFYLDQVRRNRGLVRADTVVGYVDSEMGAPPMNAALLAVTSGNLLDLAKKVAIYQKDVDTKTFINALQSIEHCMEQVRRNFGITRDEAIAHNIYKLAEGPNARYKAGSYSNEAAIARADKGGEQ